MICIQIQLCQNLSEYQDYTVTNGNNDEGFAMTQFWFNQSISQHFPGANDKYHDKPVRIASVQLKLEMNTN